MIKTYFINSTQALYDDVEFATLQSALLSQGVMGDSAGVLGLGVTQAGSPDMSVLVGTGKALVEITKSGRTFKVFVENDAAYNVPIANNGGGSNRVDAIVVRVNVALEPNVLKNNVGTIERVAGTGTSPLSDGDITSALGDDGWFRLADVTVEPAETTILNTDISDVRSQVELTDAVHIELDALSQLDTTRSENDQEQTSSASSSAVGQTDTAGGRRRAAQSFTPTRKGIRGVRLYKKADTGAFTGDVVISVQADVSGEPSGTPLATYTITNAEWLALTTDAVFELIFDPQYGAFTLGQKYWIVVVPSTGDNANCINLGAATGNPYADGNIAYFNTDDGWTDISGTDLYFETIELTANQIVQLDEDGYIPTELVSPNEFRFSAGSYTWTKRGRIARVQMWSAGGAGGWQRGGGGGAYWEGMVDLTLFGSTIDLVVGAGQLASAGENIRGGNSIFANNTVRALTLLGGYSPSNSNSTQGGMGGTMDGVPIDFIYVGNNTNNARNASRPFSTYLGGTKSTGNNPGTAHDWLAQGDVSRGTHFAGASYFQDGNYIHNTIFGGASGQGSAGRGNTKFGGFGGNYNSAVAGVGENGYIPGGGGGGGNNATAGIACGGRGGDGLMIITVIAW